MNVVLVASIRGNAVRVGPAQFPELHRRVDELARRIGLRRTPDVYLMQQDGALNAFALRFLRSHMVVLLSDLLEACGDNKAARDMIIGHELGHIRAGHLRARWLLMPASFVPFLGSALSRAREYTCDRYGRAAAGDHEGAVSGLAILSAGGRYGPNVNRTAFAAQRCDLSSVWMTIGEWLASHPPLTKRVAALAPELGSTAQMPARAALRWVRAAFAGTVVVVIGVGAVSAYLPRFAPNRAEMSPFRQRRSDNAEQQVRRDLDRLKRFIEAERKKGRSLPWDVWDLYARWEQAHPHDDDPIDPYSGYWYDYQSKGDEYRVWSTGPDGATNTADDVILESASGVSAHARFVSRR
jgi:hypothetical protein